MKSNDDKCHLIVVNEENVSITLGQEIIESSDSVVLLGANIDKKLNFSEHVSNLLKKKQSKMTRLGKNFKIFEPK